MSDHFKRHGADFGAKDKIEYAYLAHVFYIKNGLLRLRKTLVVPWFMTQRAIHSAGTIQMKRQKHFSNHLLVADIGRIRIGN